MASGLGKWLCPPRCAAVPIVHIHLEIAYSKTVVGLGGREIRRTCSWQPLEIESGRSTAATGQEQRAIASRRSFPGVRAPGKRIALPVRVEPKVFFANERTFLSWLNFTVILGGLAVGLLNFGDRVGQISAGIFTLVAMGIMIYALVTFHWRANAISKRGSGNYDDRIGPTALCIALLIAVVTNFILRFTKA
ncbi:hypothetical protein O181_036839 [Austropuccinia psidii MF-1]|uniref:DUF202 domain-containing protein n=1 Tax=Austropuccinia psidii MF-1 TaxID=1389203 RepID=A0A9Q3HBX8_9BASI|nr:hypothetical protein [Austropuccinia psidii MF-1]